tara:strand:+ start:614 stop:1513 length:900 start_codon:yes stop_codon:yes gene_type:complete
MCALLHLDDDLVLLIVRSCDTFKGRTSLLASCKALSFASTHHHVVLLRHRINTIMDLERVFRGVSAHMRESLQQVAGGPRACFSDPRSKGVTSSVFLNAFQVPKDGTVSPFRAVDIFEFASPLIEHRPCGQYLSVEAVSMWACVANGYAPNDAESLVNRIVHRLDPRHLATALFKSVSCGQTYLTRALITAMVDVNALDYNAETAVMIAVREGSVSCLRALLNAGSDPNTQNVAGKTALMIAACTRHRSPCVRALLEAGAYVNTTTLCGRTALGMAITHANHCSSKQLIDAGAPLGVLR